MYNDYAATALDWLYNRTDGDKHGRLVFSRNSKKNSQFGKDVFGKFMIEKLGVGMDCGSLRRRLEINAAMAVTIDRLCPVSFPSETRNVLPLYYCIRVDP